MVDEKLVTEWIKALRSGKYTQGQSYLKSTDNKYCCLGVLCETYSLLMGPYHMMWSKVSENHYRAWFGGPEVYGYAEYTVPEKLFSEVGLFNNGRLGLDSGGKVYNYLETANDSGVSFAVIADYLESMQKAREGG